MQRVQESSHAKASWCASHLLAHLQGLVCAAPRIGLLGVGLLLAVLMALSAAINAHAAPLAGTSVVNRAQAKYTDAATGRGSFLDSNIVTVQVAQVTAFSLSSPQNKASAPGAGVRFQHTVTNLGNGPDTFALSVDNSYFGTFNFTSVTLYADTNSDGVPDDLTPITSTPILAPGQSYALVAVANVPTTAVSGQEDRFVVSAQSARGGVPVQSNIDIVNITNNAVINVTKSFSETVGPSPYAGLVVTLTYSNIGNTAATNVQITDIIGTASISPAYNSTGLSYQSASGRWQGIPVSDASGGDPNGVNYQATTVGGVTTVQATIAGVAPGASGTVSFKVDVKPGLTLGSLYTNNAASINYFDGSSSQTTYTNNTVFYSVAPSGADLQLSKTAQGALIAGAPVDYRLRVRNVGAGASIGTVTVTDTFPVGFLVNVAYLPTGQVGSSSGQWQCSIVNPGSASQGVQVACSNPMLIPAGQDHPQDLILRATPPASLAGLPATNTANVSGGGEPAVNANNNEARHTDLVILGASISGRAWLDLNHNRRYEANEPPAPNVVVELVNANNVMVATTRTDSQGTYQFSNMIPGAGYRIVFRAIEGTQPQLGFPVNGEQGAPHPSSDAALSLKGVIEGLTLKSGSNVLEQSLPLDPSGVVYDASTRKPVAGATVSISGPPGFDPAIHLVGSTANVTQLTGPTGYYQYLLLPGAPAGVYRLKVVAPTGYVNAVSAMISPSPSRACSDANCLDPTGLAPKGGAFSVQPANIASAPPLGQDTTYYLSFYLDPETDPHVVNNHIPLDPINQGAPGLFLQKLAGRSSAEIGDSVPYQVKIRNAGTAAVTSVELRDQMPTGFKLIPGTVRVDGQPIPDPVQSAGSGRTTVMNFSNIGTLNPNATATVTYFARLMPGAQDGDGINRAQAASGSTRSNVAVAKVQIVGGVFSQRAYITGKIFVDCNNNHVQDREEIGIPGVRVFLQDGSFVITDSEGKYSFAGLPARSHVLKLDSTTLPAKAYMAATSNRHLGIGDSRLVDLKRGELHRADFAETSCSAALLETVQLRRKKGEVFGLETDRAVGETLVIDPKVALTGDARALPASGLLTKPASVSTSGSALANPLQAMEALTQTNTGPQGFVSSNDSPTEGSASGSAFGANSTMSMPTSMAGSASSVAAMLEAADNTLGFLYLKDRDTLPIAQTAVRIKGQIGGVLSLKINGEEVPSNRIGTRSEITEKQLQFREYVGIALNPGENTLELSQKDPFGNDRGQQTIVLIAPDSLGKIQFSFPGDVMIADGRTPVKVKVALTDSKGVPVTVRTSLTLEASRGRWAVKDQDPGEPGVQVFLTGGSGEFEFMPPLEPGDLDMRISSGVLKREKKIAVLPELRPLIASGVLEGVINAHKFSNSQLLPARSRDGFEMELKRFARESGDTAAAARAAFFLKGKLRGDYLLTLAYDSEKEVRERLFRDIQPNEFYPVYGDSAIRGFDAQSTSRLYLRIDKHKSYLLWGDYTTASTYPAQRLAQYQRALTGVKHHLDTGLITLDTFASKDSVRQVIREFPAIGLSGPFDLGSSTALTNSERVEVLVRDRNQPAVILRTTVLTRFADYELEPLTGRIWLKAPLASVDPQLHPISLRVTVEVDQGGKSFWVGGAAGQYRVTEKLTLGGVLVRNTNPVPESFATMAGASIQYKPSEKTTLDAEVASTNNAAGVSGQAARAEWTYSNEGQRVRVHAGRADAIFDNPASTLSKGREEAGAKVETKVGEGSKLVAEAIHSKDLNTQAKRDGALLAIEQQLNRQVKVELGLRHVQDSLAPGAAVVPGGANRIDSVRSKLSLELPQYASTAYIEAEQDVHDSDKRILALGGTYQFAGNGKLYARHEFQSTLRGAFDLNNTQRQHNSVLGVSADYMQNGSVFSEYRTRDAFDQRSTEAALGLRNFFNLQPGLRLNTNLERVRALAGRNDNDSLAIATGLDYTASEWWKASGRVEYRDATTTRSWLHTLGLGVKLDRDLSLLAKHSRSDVDTKAQGAVPTSNRLLQRSQLGLAWRETDQNRLNALAMIEHKREDDSAASAQVSQRQVNVFSTHANWQPWRSTVFTGNYAYKQAREKFSSYSSSAFTSRNDWAALRATVDITKRWDIGTQVSVLRNLDTGISQRGFGAEIGYLLKEDLWLSLGYNRFGYNDRDLTAGQYTDKGFYLRLRYKFDEDLFKFGPK